MTASEIGTTAMAAEIDMELAEAEGAPTAKRSKIPIPCGAEPWNASEYLTNEEALEILVGRDSGVRPELSRLAYRFAKRVFDIVASAAAIAVLLVPGLALCAIICAKSPGAGPIYSQWRMGRVGRDGSYRAFRMYKFRSMVPYADEMLAELQGSNEASGPMFKMRDDPRIIPGTGQFIRKHSVDELPQLINVFKGDMSLIGPRPGLPREVALYDARAVRRLSVKPGCGGAWQTSGRSDVGFERMVELDLDYIENQSLCQDMMLILRTAKVVLSGKGAR